MQRRSRRDWKKEGKEEKSSVSIIKKKFNLAVQQGKQDSKQDKVKLVSVSQPKSARFTSEGIIKDVDKIAELEIEPDDKQKKCWKKGCDSSIQKTKK